MLPIGLLTLAVIYFIRFKKYHVQSARAGKLTLMLVSLLVLQILLGILTVVNCNGGIPVGYGIAHQAIGVMLFIVTMFLFYSFGKRRS